jgi:DNA-binding IclR family transcriptional regulator
MLFLKAQFLSTTALPSRGDYPPSQLTTVLDDTGETLNLVVLDDDTVTYLKTLKQLETVLLHLRWRKVSLSATGSGKGNAYRLTVISHGNMKELS